MSRKECCVLMRKQPMSVRQPAFMFYRTFYNGHRSVVDVANTINVPVVDGALRFRRSKQAAVHTFLPVN